VRAKIAAAGVFLALATAYPALAAPGDLDPGFGEFGRIVHRDLVDHELTDATLLPDGRVVAVGHDHGERYGGLRPVALAVTPAGAIDPSFGDQGKTVLDPSRGYQDTASAAAVAVQPDGRIVLAGAYRTVGGYRLFAARLDPSGEPDPSFGEGGIATYPVPAAVYRDAVEVALAPGDRIVIASDDRLVRLNPDGDLDPSFAGDGELVTPLAGGQYYFGTGLGVMPDGRIVVGGGDQRSPAAARAAIARYLPDGSPDSGWGDSGVVRGLSLGKGRAVNELVVDSSGGVTGVVVNSQGQSSVLVRLTTAGKLDRSYSRDGVTRAVSARLSSLLFEDGRALAAGSDGREFVLARYRPDGKVDRTFSRDGKLRTNLGGNGDAAVAVLRLASGAILAVGNQGNSASRYSLVYPAFARYLDGGRRHDADADGRVDRRDRCPNVSAVGHRGCPYFEGSVTLRESPNGESLSVWLNYPSHGCERAGPVKLMRAVPGRDELVMKRRRTFPNFPVPDQPGRYYARVPRRIVGGVGICEGARSYAIKVG